MWDVLQTSWIFPTEKIMITKVPVLFTLRLVEWQFFVICVNNIWSSKPRTDEQFFPWQVYFLVCTTNNFSLTAVHMNKFPGWKAGMTSFSTRHRIRKYTEGPLSGATCRPFFMQKLCSIWPKIVHEKLLVCTGLYYITEPSSEKHEKKFLHDFLTLPKSTFKCSRVRNRVRNFLFKSCTDQITSLTHSLKCLKL